MRFLVGLRDKISESKNPCSRIVGVETICSHDQRFFLSVRKNPCSRIVGIETHDNLMFPAADEVIM